MSIYLLSKRENRRIYPINGRLDLEAWNQQDGPLSLSGGWDFYWEKLLTYRDLKSHPVPDLAVQVPEVWNRYQIKGKNLPGFGYATYRLKVIHVQKGKPLALMIPTFSTSYKLYIDTDLVSANGRVGSGRKQSTPQYLPRSIEFTPAKTSFELIVQVANYTYSRGGMWYALELGTPEQIRRLNRNNADKDLLLIGALSVMALYYLSIFLLRREDKSSLYFVFMCLIFASRVMVYGDYFIYRLIPAIPFQAIIAIAYLSLCWFPIFAVLFVGELFPAETSSGFKKAALLYGGIMAAMFSFTPIAFFTRLIFLVQMIAMATGFYAIVCLIKAYLNRKKDALLVLGGSLTVIIFAGRDMLYQNNIILSNYGELVQVGLFILLFTQSFVLARRFSEAFRNVEALSRKLLKLDKIKDEFLANTSHELRTPLNGILGITEALLRGGEGEVSSGQKQSLFIIANSCRRLANLINDILDYSKLKYGDIRLHIKPVRLDGLIQTVVKVFQQLSQTKEYEVTADLPSGLPPVMADENRVVQILYNLIGNAAKFTTRGYIKVSAGVNVNMLEVCISDSGEGIPPDKLDDIFKSFEQVDTSLTRKHGGTGLGLSITKQLVELQGGSIWVHSTPGTGSEFYFTLPIAVELPPENETELALPELAVTTVLEPQVAMKKETADTRVLLVDDDPVNLQSSTTLLKLGGFAVTAVNSGKAALTEIGGHHDYTLVILDVMMPEMSGYEVCRKIREGKSPFELPVLMLTAKTSLSDIVTGFEAGANDYLMKPFEPEELLTRVGTLVNLKKSVDKAISAEVAFMQAQIKPHFLFNTLNTISSFCDTAPDQARKLIDEFSNYLQQSFDFKNPQMYVPLADELNLIKSYAEIEKARFGADLKVEFEIDEAVEVKIPSLSIQPLVENAIHHGIRKKGGNGTVTITVQSTPEGILVDVTDDGAGIPPEKLEHLLQVDSGRGVGLWNIDARLRKLFGHGLTIRSEPGKGTRVMFLIPPEVKPD